MSTTSIEWTEKTWNPIAGCSLVSKGCTNCYAMRMAARLELMGQKKYAGLTQKVNGRAVWTAKLNFDETALLAPLKWKKPSKIFVNSMSDLFHENVTDDQIQRIFLVMRQCPQHTFQVLTKRPQRMAELKGDTLPNVWLGTSCEDQPTANERIPHLLKTPAAVRFLSCEPLLGPIDLTNLQDGANGWLDCLSGVYGHGFSSDHKGDGYEGMPDGITGEHVIHWLIAGGESGPGARPMHPNWVRSLRDQCAAAAVPFFFKQWGAWAEDYRVNDPDLHVFQDNTAMRKVGKKAAGRLLDGKEHNAMPTTVNS